MFTNKVSFIFYNKIANVSSTDQKKKFFYFFPQRKKSYQKYMPSLLF